ncbi:DUF3426 domain-containing protein [Pseudomonas stutzeri]|jgi:predicted Zn finger-like uncharacterized protein|uniref:Zinc finger/thioredoxin putative domain-containing protein n=1 Tax=Stutzerimonas stutzeri NF13 TaxID=1212548 RepID=M2TM85_STUST|nr:DUF3426 domain-containing protein [Stutzerimonas stutzeri]EMD98380.1 hypothetical protein B381_19561 [Stutzerimonas stutzeri NF13]MBK3880079.1 DUF3426 domain-containing protein [Stutzerimonas stutzeri]MCQ4293419.1 zinc-ribbon domain-containing protein [Stutzerimonas stutzeri]WOF78032.1 DUF3426 domain-containing protein [Pseudomonas sp. FeN3W]
MTSFITQCPNCSTRFRIARSQLRVARGAVRCGACLEVFNAAHHLLRDELDPTQPLTTPVDKPIQTQTEPPKATSPAPASKADETLWIHDDLDLDSLDLDEELAKLEQQERELSRDLLNLEASGDAATRPRDPLAEITSTQDESWAEILLSAEQGATQPTTSPSDEAVSFIPVTAESPQPLSPLAASPTPLANAKAQQAHDERVEPEVTAPSPTEPLDPAVGPVAPRREPDLRGEPLFELDDEPLQLDWQQPKKPWGRWLGWGVLNLLALLALGAQYVAYNYDELSRQHQYRSWFERICPTLGCELPALVDIDQIKSSNLVVRSHPEFTGALVVDAILYNRAAFAQPFPLLEIRFADLNGKLIASRSFKPSEYLSGELAGQAQMPPQVPIHIALDILDPGAKAVNYSLSFHSPEQ